MIFGVAGKLESGKDTVSDYLVKNYGFTKLAFADNLKLMCMEVFGLTHEQCYTTEGKLETLEQPVILSRKHGLHIIEWLEKENNWNVQPISYFLIGDVVGRGQTFNTARHILQFVGTEVMRDCVDADIHAKIVFKKVKEEQIEKVVISDARFANERTITRSEGGQMILVDCVQTREQESTHRSETGIGDPSEYNFVIENDKTVGLQPLYDKIKAMMDWYENNI